MFYKITNLKERCIITVQSINQNNVSWHHCYSKSWNVFLVKLKIHTWTGNFIVCMLYTYCEFYKSNADKFKNLIVVLLMSLCTKFDCISFKTIVNMFVNKSLGLLYKSYVFKCYWSSSHIYVHANTTKNKTMNCAVYYVYSIQIKFKFFYWFYWKKSACAN